VVVSFLIAAVLVVGCGAGGTGNNDGRGGKGGAVTTEEETTAPEANRSKAQTAQEPTGLDEQVVSPPGQANVPRGFGEGSLWATGFQPLSAACDDVVEPGEGPCSASASASAGPTSPGGGPKTLLKRVDPRTGEVVAKIEVGRGAVDIAVDESSGAVWVAGRSLSNSPAEHSEDNKLSRVDPATDRVVAEIPIRASSPNGGVSNGVVSEGAVWALSYDGRLLKVETGAQEPVLARPIERDLVGVRTILLRQPSELEEKAGVFSQRIVVPPCVPVLPLVFGFTHLEGTNEGVRAPPKSTG